MSVRGAAGTAAALVLALALSLGPGPTSVRAEPPAAVEARAVRIEARFVERASGREAPWGATGQIMVPPEPSDPAVARWPLVRVVASSPSRQSVTIAPGALGLIRVGREIPFAGWFLRHGTRCGRLEEGSEWREVESALEIEIGHAADGALRLSLTPEFGYLHGRSRRTVAFPGERVETVLSPGAETPLAVPPEFEPFYGRLLAGYDPLRRVWPVDLVLRAEYVDPTETAASAETAETATP